ncbi:Platinum sensitivity protein [Friedmanniomyces endolithicus]|nr:Platinum sensitivity protein [Friedmanniomyces endolithicus]
MAQPQPSPQQERKRVKVYELKNNDWYDRGTGFCAGQMVQSLGGHSDHPDSWILVVSEEDPQRPLLETRITKGDGYQKQQDTLIVWTEQTGVDMALSFQEAEGCSQIWDFVSEVQQRLTALGPDDTLSEDLLEPVHPVTLPDPELGRLDEIEGAMRAASTTPAGRDALAKFVVSPEQMYILKLAPLVEEAERLQSAQDLHRLCTITKHLILLNDNAIIEFVVTDQAIMGVVGALEYDPDFPSHRANHRQYLSDSSKFKEVVPITAPDIRQKIHYTYRLLYLKDVVLARILDDPTFSVLNSLIFFHQVDIINHLQQNQPLLGELFSMFADGADDVKLAKRKEAVLFIQNCCAVSKNIQAQNRAQLYQSFIHHGLFTVITFALSHHDASVRVAGTDILVSLIDHDPHMVRNHIFNAMKERITPLTDTLIDLLLVEVDLGVKSSMADAIKILLDPTSANGLEMMRAGQANSEIMAKRGQQANGGPHGPQASPQTEAFIANFYEGSAKRLFQPLKDLEHRPSMLDLTVQETSMMTHLVDCLCYFVRQHTYRIKLFIISENLHSRVAQLLASPHKYMKLSALKWFRTTIGLGDEFHNRQLIQHRLFEPILNVVYETMPRDNLLNSACLELFEFIKREGIKQLIVHLAEQYRERLMAITYVNTFQQLVNKYEQMQAGYQKGTEDSSFTTQEGTPARMMNGGGGGRFAGLREMDGDEEAYFNTDDDVDEDDDIGLPTAMKARLPNGASPVRPLVSYPDDEDEEMESVEHMDIPASSPDREALARAKGSSDPDGPEGVDTESTSPERGSPEPAERGRDRRPVLVEGSPGRRGSSPEPMAIKRRRGDEDDDDEMSKLMGGTKRRSSTASVTSQTRHVQLLDGSTSPKGAVQKESHYTHIGPRVASQQQQHQPVGGVGHMNGLRRRGSLKTKNEGGAGKFTVKPIALSVAAKQVGAEAGNGNHAGDGRGANSANGGAGGGEGG